VPPERSEAWAFLLPKLISELTPASSTGPIVTLSLSEIYNTCFALIFLPGLPSDTLTIELDSFPPSKARRLYESLQKILKVDGRVLLTDSENENSNFGDRQNDFGDSIDEVLKDLLANSHQTDPVKAEKGRDGGVYQGVGKGQRGAMEAILSELWHCIGKVVLDTMALEVGHFISASRRHYLIRGYDRLPAQRPNSKSGGVRLGFSRFYRYTPLEYMRKTRQSVQNCQIS
jgi:hypothetical protein